MDVASACASFAVLGVDTDISSTDELYTAGGGQPIAVQPHSHIGLPIASAALTPASFWEGREGEDAALLPLPHVRQLHSWDCGLACLQMILRYVTGSDCSPART